jgi:hypothetical protein
MWNCDKEDRCLGSRRVVRNIGRRRGRRDDDKKNSEQGILPDDPLVLFLSQRMVTTSHASASSALYNIYIFP